MSSKVVTVKLTPAEAAALFCATPELTLNRKKDRENSAAFRRAQRKLTRARNAAGLDRVLYADLFWGEPMVPFDYSPEADK